MSFLYLDEKTKKVEITQEGLTLPEVKELLKKDDSPGKKKSQRVFTYIYWVYNSNGMFSNKLPEERRKIVCNTYLDAADPEIYEGKPFIRAVINRYVDLSQTPTQQLYERLKLDIQDILKRISSIPFEREVILDIKQDVEVEVVFEGEVYNKVIPVSQKIKTLIDNSAEKLKSIEMTEKLFKQEERLKKIMEKEAVESGRRIFDIR